MVYWSQLLPWILRAWPLLALVPVAVLHAVALQVSPSHHEVVNKIVGAILQVAGGLIVLYSVNDNLGLFREQSLVATIVAWLKAFPLVRKPINISASVGTAMGSSAAASISVERKASTVEERITELERKLQEFKEQMGKDLVEMRERINEQWIQLERRISATSDRVAEISKKMEYAAVGGFKIQALGVLLAIYGAGTSVFA